MRRNYWVDWLKPAHARQVARLERRVYPADYCAGYHSILGDLRDAEATGRNLSMGVFLGHRLVGFLLAFHEPERVRICEYIDVPPPEGIDLSGAGIYLNDFVVHPDHRGAGHMMALRLTQVVRIRDDLRSLPVDTFSTNTMTDTWSLKVRFLKRMSIELTQCVPMKVHAGGEDLFWIVFRHVKPRLEKSVASLASRLKRLTTVRHDDRDYQIGTCTSVADWALLQPYWDELLARTPLATVFQSYDYLTTWWSLLGLKNELLIVVVLCDDGVPVAIAPMQIGPAQSFGSKLRCLSFLGHPSEVDRNTILLDPAASAVVPHIARYLMERRDSWDFVALYEQPPSSPLLHSLVRLLQKDGFIVSEVPGPECAVVRIAGTWDQFLSGKDKTFRKSVKRRLAKLDATGKAAFQTLHERNADHATTALERYIRIESSSWKRAASLGVGKTASHRGFYRQLMRTFAANGHATFHFLRLGDDDAAGTFGLCWRKTFYSLQIAHSENFAEYSPGVALTGLEMKAAFDGASFDNYDFLGGFLNNKRSWATSKTSTTALFAHRPNVNGWLFHRVHFWLRPRVRRLLVRSRLLTPLLTVAGHCRKLLPL